jgi:hypothetical protein
LKIKKLHKVFYWEHWPSSMFYIPNLPYAFYLAAKANHAAFFSAANPSIKSSGNGTESKFTTVQLIPKKYRPKSILHKESDSITETICKIELKKLHYPLILKPDIGFRGMLVKKIDSEVALKNYLKKYPVDIIIQEYIKFKNECGIFYSRNPNQEKGAITSITLKKFLCVLGDGKSTLNQLILKDKRANFYLNLILELNEDKLNSIPEKNKQIQLSVIGNHSKGTQFLNGNHLISKELTNTFDNLSKSIPGWFYGRIDLKYNDFSDLENGIDFKILEINGIIAEPTHIYDTKNSNYFQALKAIRTHWKSLYEISTTNHKDFKVPYKSSKKFISEMFELRAYSKKITDFQ